MTSTTTFKVESPQGDKAETSQNRNARAANIEDDKTKSSSEDKTNGFASVLDWIPTWPSFADFKVQWAESYVPILWLPLNVDTSVLWYMQI